MKHKKFMNIERLNTSFVEGFRTGDEIYIEEKIDGANAAIRYDSETDTVICQSRGVVIKNISRLNDPNGRLPFYTKIVGDKFIETKGQKHNKPLNPEVLAQKEAQMSLASTIVTKARVEKILHKFVDENILPEDWDSKDMPTVAKHLTKAIYEDCLKEEKATVDNIPDFGKIANGICMRLAREILNAKCSPAS